MERYEPEIPAEMRDPLALMEFLLREHQRIANALAGALPSQLDELHAEPIKLREFMIVAADGTDWNPGGGKGVYAYYSGTWNKLG